MISFLAVFPILAPFVLFLTKRKGLPDKLIWWKSYAAGFWTYLFYLLVSWIIRLPAGMIPSFLSDYFFWALELFLSIGIAAFLGVMVFKSSFFSGFLKEATVYPFFSGLFLPMGIDTIIRYPTMRDPFLLFFLPLVILSFILLLSALFGRYLSSGSSKGLAFVVISLAVSFLFALVPALFYSFYWLGAAALFTVFAAGSIYLVLKENIVS